MMERLREPISRRLARALVTERVPLALDRAAVSFTFDDIPVSAIEAGAPVLEERGVRGTFYVCGELAGTKWPLYPLAGLDGVAVLAGAGHEIGCHTASHLDASRTAPGAFARDVEANARILAPVVGRELTTFAYPYGAIGLRNKFATQARFAACRGIHGGMAVGSYDRGRLDATALENATIDEQGVDALLDEAVRRNAWLTFYSHDVAAEPTRFGVTPELLAYAVSGAIARGCIVDTVEAVAKRNQDALGQRSAA